MRPILALALALVTVVPAAAAEPPVAIDPTGDASASLVAVSGTGAAAGGWTGVSGTGDARGGLNAVSVTGNATAPYSCLLILWMCYHVPTVSGTGRAEGSYAVGVAGESVGCRFYDCVAASVLGDAHGPTAVTVTGDATSPITPVSVLGTCNGRRCLYVGLDSGEGYWTAMSLSGDATTCTDELHCTAAASAMGRSTAYAAAASATGPSEARVAAASITDEANAGLVAASVVGPATGAYALSPFGDAHGRTVGVSLTGQATGSAGAFSACRAIGVPCE